MSKLEDSVNEILGLEKRTYKHAKDHGNDMSYENEVMMTAPVPLTRVMKQSMAF